MKRNIFSIKKLAIVFLCLFAFVGEAFGAWSSANNQFEITSCADLKNFASYVNGGKRVNGGTSPTNNTTNPYAAAATVVLTTDIDCSKTTGLTPIGTSTDNNKYFRGTFDGDGYSITGFTLNTNSTYAGLFGYVSGATIKNVSVDVAITQTNTGTTDKIYAGGLVAYLNTGTISNCLVSGTVKSTQSNAKLRTDAGGVAGYMGGGTISDCLSLVAVEGIDSDRSNLGGIVGFLQGASSKSSTSKPKIERCVYDGTGVVVDGKIDGGAIVGCSYNYVIVESCYFDSDKLSNASVMGNNQGTNSGSSDKPNSGKTTDELISTLVMDKLGDSWDIVDGVPMPNGFRRHTVTVIYTYSDGSKTDTTTTSKKPGETYSITTPEVTGYTPDKTVVSGIMGTSDINVIVTYSPSTYIITYNKGANGTGSIPAGTKTYGDAFTLSTDKFTRSGYEQVGWARTDGGEQAFALGGSYTDDADVTLYPVWMQLFTVTFNANGHGTAPASQNVLDGEKATAPTAPSATGYSFNGWNTKQDGTGTTWDFSTNTVTAATTLYAMWTVETYTITYEMDGGINNTNNPATYTVETAVTFQEPNKVGYGFDGWYEESDFTTKVTGFTAGSKTGAYTVYAKWGDPIEYSITYNLDGGTNAAVNPAKYTIESETFTIADPTKTGYTFDGWFSDEELETAATTTIAQGSTGDVVLYAKWTVNSYTATFDANGGEFGEGAVTTKSVDYDAAITATDITEPTREGYAFKGWALTSDATAAAENLGTMNSTEGVTIYAVWLVKSFTITLEPNGGTLGTGASPITQEYGSEIATRANPTKTGYTFAGWFENEELSGDAVTIPATMPAKTYTLYAKWTANSYTATFNANGGEFGEGVTTATKQVAYDATITATDITEPTREGYAFKGWALTSDATAAAENLGTMNSTEGVTIYAVWLVKSFTITLEPNGGTLGTGASPITQEYGSEIATRANPTKTGYTFAGWFENEELSGDAVTIPATMPAKTYTLYAKWNMDVQATAFTGTYDGEPHGITVTAPAGATVTYSTAADGTYGDAITYTEAGAYTVYYKASQTGYADVKGSSTVTINQAADLAISKFDGATFTYDAAAHALSTAATTNAVSGTTVVEYSFDKSVWVSDLASLTKVAAGTYTVNVKATNPNYSNTAEGSATLTINKAAMTVKVVGSSSTVKYDGEEHSVSGYTATSESGLYDANKVTFSGTAEAKQTTVGTANMGLTAAMFSYDDTNIEATFDITDGYQTISEADEVVVTITGHKSTVNYNGGIQEVTGYDFSADNALYTTSDFEFTGTAKASGMVTGTYDMGLAVANFSNKNANFSKVTFKVTDGQLTINPIATPIVITAASDEKVYNGTALTNSTYTFTDGVVLTGDELSATVEGTITNAGSADNVVKSYKVMNGITDVTSCYTFGESVKGTLTVNKATLNVKTESASRAYNGEALTAGASIVSGLVGSETATIAATGSQTIVGSTDNTYEITWGTAKESNYTVSATVGTLEVTAAAFTVTLSDNVTYNGTKQTPTVTVKDANDDTKTLELNTDYTVAWDNDGFTNAGDYKVTVTGKDNYTGSVEKTYKIGKPTAHFTGESATKTYTGSEIELTDLIVEGLVTGHKHNVSYSNKATEVKSSAYIAMPTAAGEGLQITDAEGNDVTDNYYQHFTAGYLTIKPATDLTVALSNAAYDYDGNSKALTAAATVSATSTTVTGTSTIEYQFEGDGETWVSDISSLTKVDAGVYTVNVRATNPNYSNTATNSATLTITPATLTVAGEDYENVYDGASHGAAAVVKYGETVVTDATVEYSTDNGTTWSATVPTIKDVGSKTIKVRANKTNYAQAEDDYSLVVTAREVTLSWDPTTFVYDGNSHIPTATAGNVVDGETVTVTVDASGAKTDVGTDYVATATALSSTNYKLPEANTTTFSITPATITITAIDQWYTYTGSAQQATAAKTDVAGATITYSVDDGTTWSATVPSLTDADTVTVTVKAEKANYATATNTFKFGMAQANINDVTVAIEDWTYGETAKVPTTSATFKAEGEPSITYSVKDANSWSATVPTDAGEYTVKATVAETANYVGGEATQDFEILPATITITAIDQWYTYTGSAQQATAAKTDVAGATITYSVDDGTTWSATVPSLTDADTVTVTVKAEKANYATATNTFKFGMAQANINDVTVAIEDWTYGETAKVPTTSATFKAEGEPSITYSVKDANSWSATVPTDAGEYTVKAAVAETANYVGGEATKDFTIARATATVIAVANGKTYGAEEPTLTAEVTGLKNGDAASVISYSVSRAPGADVGKYTITPSGDAEQGNYNVEYMTADFTITKAMTNNVTVSINNWGYGTTPAIPSFTADFGEEAAYTYSVKGADVWNETKPSAAGEYTIKATVAGTDNYVGGEATKDFTIGEAVINITAPDQLYDYDGSAHGVAVTADVDGVTIIYSYATSTGTIPPQLTDADTIVVEVNATKENYTPVNKTYRLGVAKAKTNNVTVGITGWTYGETAKAPMTSATFKAEGEPSVTYSVKGADSWSTEVPTDAGEYTVKATVAETANYVGGEATQDFTIAPATMTLVVAGYAGTYDGVAHSGTVTPSATTGTTVSYKVGEGDWSTTVPTFTDADTVEVKVKAVNSNYQPVEDSYTVAIAKKAIEVAVSGNSGSTTYDGKDHAVEGFTAMTEETLYDVKSVALVDGKFASATTKNVDKVMMGLTKDSFVNNDNNFTATFTVTDGYSEVTAREVTLSWDSTTFVYNGDAHLPAATAGNVVDGETVTVTVDASGAKTDVGTDYVATATALSSTNYKLPEANTTTFSITPATITITAIDQWYTYTGSAQQATAAKTDVAGATITYSVDDGTTWSATVPSLTDADTVTVTVKAEKANYATATNTFKFGMAQANINDVTVAIEDWTYGETAKVPTTSATFKAEGEPSITYSVKDANSWSATVPTDAGEYTVKATVAETANYVGGEATQDFEILPATITITAIDQWYTYTGSAQQATAAKTDVAGATITYSVDDGTTWSATVPSLTDADTVTVTVKAEKANYATATNTFKFGMAQANINDVTVAIEDWTYGETAKVPTTSATFKAEGEPSITYSVKDANSWSATVPTDAGEYTVKAAVAETANYVGGEATQDFTIAKKAAKITVTAASKTYGDVDPTFTGKVEGLVNDADLGTIAYVRVGTDERAAVHQDELTATYTKNNNYDVSVVPANFTIKKREVSFTGETATEDYTGSEIELTEVTADGLVDGHTHNVTYSAKGTEVGDYDGEITAVSAVKIMSGADDVTKNYTITTMAGKLTIQAAGEFFIALADTAITYDGTAHYNGYTATSTAKSGTTTFQYQFAGDAEWTADLTSLTKTAAGEYIINVKGTNPNYTEAATTTAKLIINRAAVVVVANDNQKVFGMADPTLTATVTGTIGDDKVEYTLARATGETAGKYVITASGDAIQGNYAVSFTNGVFTISPVVTVVLADSVQLVCTEGATGAENCTEDGKSIDHTYGEETSPLPGAVIVDVTTGAVDTTWHFQGWFENEDGIEPKVTKIDADETDPVVIYPFFEKTIEVVIGDSTTIPVVIDNNDTKDSIEAKVKEAAENSEPPIKPNPETYVKEPYEYTYSGEYECELKEDKYLCEAIFDSTAITYDVVINLPDSIKLDCTNSNGCTVDPKTGDTTVAHKYGEETILPTANVVDSKTGKVDSTWEFQGWFDNEDGRGDTIKTIGADVYGDTTIYPFFTKELDVEIADTTITVVIDNNDSKDSVDNKVTDAIREAGIKDPTKPADSKYSYEFEKYEYDMETGKVTPVFKPTGREYKIVYVMPKAAQLSKEIKTYTYGVGTVLPTASIKGGKDWMFMGWYADEGFIGERTKEITKKDVGKKVLYPMFQKDLRYITRDESGVISVLYDEDVVNAIERTLAGVRPADYDESGVAYTFSKWVEKNGVYTAEYTEKTGINHRAIANFQVMVSGRTLEISGAKMGAKIAVFDMSGRMVAQGIVENGTTRVDLAKAGSYVVRVNNQVNRVNVR
ncbi:MAG: InlB B-repeat-containing protein [Fibrobacter sp.]|nr:InlB B-repeat-containing protein [Fibrobacter sp.]